MTVVVLSDPALVLMVGIAGAGKSTFCARHFRPEEVVSSDSARAEVAGADDRARTDAAFELVRERTATRLAAGGLVVVDATNLRPEHRRPFLRMARDHDVPAAAVVLNVSEALARERNRTRPERRVAAFVIAQQRAALRRSMHRLEAEGFDPVLVLHGAEEVDEAEVQREPAATAPPSPGT